jgi:hypothetical protein
MINIFKINVKYILEDKVVIVLKSYNIIFFFVKFGLIDTL